MPKPHCKTCAYYRLDTDFGGWRNALRRLVGLPARWPTAAHEYARCELHRIFADIAWQYDCNPDRDWEPVEKRT